MRRKRRNHFDKYLNNHKKRRTARERCFLVCMIIIIITMNLSVFMLKPLAATNIIKLSKSSVRITKGESEKITVKIGGNYKFKKVLVEKNCNRKAVKLTVKDNKVIVKGLKKGTAKVILKVKYTNRKKTKTKQVVLKVIVKDGKEKHTHTWDKGSVTREATCKEKGTKTYLCVTCGEKKTEEIPAKGHKIVVDKTVAPTSTRSGLTEGSHCSRCNGIIKKQNIIPATGPTEESQQTEKSDWWSFENGTLRLSEIHYNVQKIAGSNYYIYDTPWVKSGIVITDIVINGDAVYVDVVNGQPSSGNRERAVPMLGMFAGISSLKSVTIQNLNVHDMKNLDEMFMGCTSLTDVKITNIKGAESAKRMFWGDEALKHASVEIDCPELKTVERMFSRCSSLSKINIYLNAKNIEDFSSMFSECSSLTSVDLGEIEINDANVAGMFWNCSHLQEVLIRKVSMKNTIEANAMFNTDNAITDYSFAEHWDVSSNICLIADECYEKMVVYEPESSSCSVTVCYKKTMPKWYEEYVENLNNLEDMMQIVDTKFYDLYVSEVDNNVNKELTASEIVGAVLDSYAELESKMGNEEVASIFETAGLTKDVLEQLVNMAEGDYEVKDVLEFILENTI